MRIFGFGTDPRQPKAVDAHAIELVKLREQLASAKKALAAERAARSKIDSRYVDEIGRANRIAGRLADAHRALRDIKRMATPHCAHIGRKMAARADEALPADMGGHPNPDASAQFQPRQSVAGQEVRA
jgi:hypothetical protein